MIIKEFYKTRADGVNLYKIYSDENFYIRQVETEHIYGYAIDVENAPYTYEETENIIEIENQTYSKLEIRRACRALGIENKLNALLELSEEFKNDWLDAQEIDLTDSVLLEALKAGKFTDDEIKTIKDLLNDI